MTPRILVATLGALWFLGAAAPALAQAAPGDEQLLQDVARDVRGYANYTVFDDISAAVHDGVVTLTGKVTLPFKRDDVQARVARVPGVVGVVNEIAVLPVSSLDDELRYRISRAIYGNPSFWHYASMVNPPIHIVVEHGHVTLTGVVQSHLERMLARSIAVSFGAFSVKNDLRTDAEVRAALE